MHTPRILCFGALSTLLTTAAVPQAGTLDPTFGINGMAAVPYGTWDGVGDLVVLPDDAVILAGAASSIGDPLPALVLVKWTADGLPYPGFGDGGVAVRSFESEEVRVCGVGVLGDGRILVGGDLWDGESGWASDGFLARFHADGTIDGTFGDDGVATFALGGSMEARAMALLPDGRTLFTGTANAFWSPTAFVARLNPDGSLDPTFGDGGIRTMPLEDMSSSGTAVAGTADGRIVMAGEVSTGSNHYGMVMARLTSAGLNDPTSGAGGLVLPARPSPGRRLLVQGDGGMLVVVWLNDGMSAMRFTSTGALDATFGTGGIATAGAEDPLYSAGAQDIVTSDGGFVLVGGVFDGSEYRLGLARFMADGTPDPAFGEQGVAVDEEGVRTVGIAGALQSDGRLVVACPIEGGDFAVARYNTAAVGIGEHLGAITSAAIFPNPVADRFTLSFEMVSADALSIDLRDMHGRIVHRFAQRSFAAGAHRLDLPWPADANAGAYTIAIASAQGNAFVKVLH